MVREIFKLALAAAIIVIAGGLIALFASGYISAFKPGGTKEAAGGHVVGGTNTISGAGGLAAVSTPAPAPSPGPAYGTPGMAQAPQGPGPTLPPPPEQPLLMPETGENPSMPAMPPSMPPGTPEPGIIQDRPTPWPALPPALQPPVQAERPGFTWPPVPLPGQAGWLQTSNWLLRIIPALFPGLFPGWTWWTKI